MRVLRAAEALCPAEAHAGTALLLQTLWELGRDQEALRIALAIESNPRASPEALLSVRALRRWPASPPIDGRALIDEALARARSASAAETQRRLDRGLAALELATARTAAVRWMYMPDTTPRSWSRDGRWFLAPGGSLGLADDAKLELVFENLAQRPRPRLALPRADEAELSPDGATLALRTKDAVRVVRVPSGDPVLETRGTAWTFWPDGKQLIVDQLVDPARLPHAVYDLGSGTELGRFGGSFAFRGGMLVALGEPYGTQFLRGAPLGPIVFAQDEADLVAFRPDGARLAHCKTDQQSVTILDVQSGTVTAESPLPFGCGSLAWTRDGRGLVVARGAAQVGLFDGETGRPRWTRNGDEDEGTTRIAFTPDGRWLCAAYAFRQECSWEYDGQRLIPSAPHAAFVGEDFAVMVPMSERARIAAGDPRMDGDAPIVTLSGDGKLVAEVEDVPVEATRTLTQVAFYDAVTRRLLHSVPLFPTSDEPDRRENSGVEFSEDGKRLHVKLGGGARFIDVEQGRVLADATGATLWSDPRSALGEREFLELESGARLELAPARPVIAHLGAGRVIARVPSGLRVQDWRTGRAVEIRGALTPSALSHDGRWLAFAHNSRFNVRDLDSNRTVRSRVDTPTAPLAVSAEHLATVGTDEVSRKGTVRLERTASGAATGTLALDGYASSVQALAFDPSGATLVISAGNDGCEAWDVATGQRLWAKRRLSLGVPASFARDTALLGPWLIRTRTGRKIARLDGVDGERVRATALRADGRLAAIALDDAVRVYDVASGRELASLPIRGTRLVFDDASDRLVTGDGEVNVWDATTGAVELSLVVGDGGSVAFDPAGGVELLGPDPSSLREQLACTVGQVVVPFLACEERLLRVGLRSRLDSDERR